MPVTSSEAGARRAMLVCRIGADLLNTPGTDASVIRVAGWRAIRDLTEETPGLRAVRMARTSAPPVSRAGAPASARPARGTTG